MKAFISYSHKDEKYLERLKVHLAQMKREGSITEWTDREIHAGETLGTQINEALIASEIFLALVSPDYIASNYCYEREFKTAQSMQEKGVLIIVPVILEPCDWQQTPFAQLKALPKDGKAVSEWTNPNNAFLNVIDELRRLIEYAITVRTTNEEESGLIEKLSRNYKVKKHFSEVDKFNFREKSFEEIKKYFQASIAELDSVENIQALFTNEGKGYFMCLISNRANNQNCHITINVSSEGSFQFGDLSYIFKEQVNPNSIPMDNIFKIQNDEYQQFWTKISYGSRFSNDSVTKYFAVDVAEEIWNDFISQVGVSVE